MKRLGAVLRWTLIVLLVLFLAVWAVIGRLGWRAMESVARTEGELSAPGLDAPVALARDARGVPHIFAETDHDAAYALGFAHAQDRLWQMHINRWYLRGRLASVLGPLAADTDAQMRVYGLADAADRLAADLSEAEIAQLRAYADGVNAAMDEPGFIPPLEFLMLAVAPEPWRPADSILMYKGLAFDLMDGEAFGTRGRTRLAEILTPAQREEFIPPYPEDGPVTLSAEELGLTAGDAPAPTAPAAETDDAPQDGSNSWVVSGAHTATGAPLLAIDPHLSHRAPGTWYLAALRGPEGAAVGATLPGLPGVVIGHNGRIAWGMTVTGADVADLVIAPETDVTDTREETIAVRFGPDRTIAVRRTPEGPVLEPGLFQQAELAGPGELAVLRWPLDDPADRTVAAPAQLNRAQNWEEFVAALRPFHAPMLNVFYADTGGDIGMISPAFVPVRGPGGAWTGAIPFEDLPRAHNPADGVIVNANNKLVPDAYPYAITETWAAPWRAQRIERLLEATGPHTAGSFAEIQLDVASDAARRMLPTLLQAQPETESGQAALDVISQWDGRMTADSPGALIYVAWLRALGADLYEDELGEDFFAFHGPRTSFMANVLTGQAAHWCDDTRTPGAEDCAGIAGPALDDAAADLRARYGGDPDRWRWGQAHNAYFGHAPFGLFPVLDRIFSARIPVGGDATTVNEAGFSYYGEGHFRSGHGPSLRAVYDLSDLDASLWAMPMGQSGHLASPHYRDLLRPWAQGEYFQIRTDWTLESAPAGAEILTLAPGNP